MSLGEVIGLWILGFEGDLWPLGGHHLLYLLRFHIMWLLVRFPRLTAWRRGANLVQLQLRALVGAVPLFEVQVKRKICGGTPPIGRNFRKVVVGWVSSI